MERLKGTVEDLRFRNETNGYTVFVLSTDDDAAITVTGNIGAISPGDSVIADGEFVIHPQYGPQFSASALSVVPPVTTRGIVKFLSSGLIKNCGIKLATAIVDKFGDKTVEIFEKEPERLSEVNGISKKRALSMAKSFTDEKTRRDTLMFLSSYGVSTALSIKLFDKYGAATIQEVKNNPYILAQEFSGVGFITADLIAQKLGVPKDSPFRIKSGITYSLIHAAEKDGDTYLPKADLIVETKKNLGVNDDELIEKMIDELRIDREIVEPFEDCLMPAYYCHVEKAAAVKIVEQVDLQSEMLYDPGELIAEYEKMHDITLHPTQKEAVMNAISHGVSIVTGGPGTGKTTIINCILYILDLLGGKSLLLAPTGRAAKRITESCGREAFTIHRALLAIEEGEKFRADTVIIDEFSMVDIFLFDSLLDAVGENARVVIVGDADQLPSVGPGNVLRDLIESKLIPVTKLSHIYRQAETSQIIVSAHSINEGVVPDLSSRDGDFYFFPCKETEKIADLAVDLVKNKIPQKFGIDPSRIQVIAAMKKGEAGVIRLNERLQLALNPNPKKSLQFMKINFSVGDRVMHTVNNYELLWTRGMESGKGVFNGDIGIITDIFGGNGDIAVEFEDGRRVVYGGDDRSQLILSYAVTVHKSQGCEFDAVVMPIVGGSEMMMTRNLLYTAITRAKKLCVLVGEKYNVERMVNNNYIAKRYSLLNRFIEQALRKRARLFV